MLLAHNGVSRQKTQPNNSKQPSESKVEEDRSTSVSEPQNLPTKPKVESQPRKIEKIPTHNSVESHEKSVTVQKAQSRTEFRNCNFDSRIRRIYFYFVNCQSFYTIRI